MVQGLYPQNNFNIEDYKQVKRFAQDTEKTVESFDDTLTFAMLESIPVFRRVSSLPNKLKNDDYIPALGLASLALINLPEDWRDMKAAGKQIYSKVNKKYKYDALYNRKDYQHSFSFLRGTMIERKVNKKARAGSKFANLLKKSDQTVAKTKFGWWVQNQLGVTLDDRIHTKIKNGEGAAAKAYKFKGSAFGKTTARAMKRLPILSVIALAALELPKIFKSSKKGDTTFRKADEMTKQTVKSAVNVSSVLAGVGYGGALGAKYGGATGSLVGMGLGVIFGSKASEKIQGLIG